MHSLLLLAKIIWITRNGLQVILFGILVRRRFYHQSPAFFFYMMWKSIRGITLVYLDFAPHLSGTPYYYAFTLGGYGESALGFVVLYELLKHLIRDYPALTAVGNSLYRWTALAFIAIAIALAWFAPASGSGRLMATYFEMQRTLSLLQCGLLVFLFIFARSFGLSWRNRVFGIALGFGMFATSNLAIAAIRSQIQPVWDPTQPNVRPNAQIMDGLTLIDQVIDLLAVAVWIAYALAKETKKRRPPIVLPEHDLQSWNQEVRKLVP